MGVLAQLWEKKNKHHLRERDIGYKNHLMWVSTLSQALAGCCKNVMLVVCLSCQVLLGGKYRYCIPIF